MIYPYTPFEKKTCWGLLYTYIISTPTDILKTNVLVQHWYNVLPPLVGGNYRLWLQNQECSSLVTHWVVSTHF